MKKRFFAALLALLLVVSLAPAAVFATETDGETGDPTGEIEETQADEPEASEEAEEDPAEAEEDPAQEEDPAADSSDDPAQEAEEDPASGEAVTVTLETEETEAVVLGTAALTAVEGTALTSTGGNLSGDYYLAGNVSLNKAITIQKNKTVTIDLNGFTLTGPGSTSVITVYGGGTLILKDSSEDETGVLTGGSASYGGGVYIMGSGTFTMYSGTISGNSATNGGGGVYIGGGGTFTMYGGTISGNSAKNGGGVFAYNTNCKFTMYGGTITSNTATSYGGGVYVQTATFTMYGGTISENKATSYGGGVYIYSTTGSAFIMESGTISTNTANYSGGVYIGSGGTFTMTGGTITENSATTYHGGGVYGSGTFTVSGTPVISGNTAGTAKTTENVYLLSTKNITLGGTLTTGASIGVTKGISGESVQITTETGTTYYSGASSYFIPDNTAYDVRENADGYLELYKNPITGSVTIAGEAVYGQTLTAEVSAETPTDVKYQWMREDAAIENATSDTYTLTMEDIDKEITVVVTHSDYIGSLTSEAVTVAKLTLNAALDGTVTKTYDGTTAVPDDHSLTVTLSGMVGDDDPTFTVEYAYNDEKVGTSKEVTATIALTDLTDYYELESETVTANVGTIEAKELTEDAFTVDVEDETYTGADIIKAIVSGLEAGTDYTVSYDDNVNAGVVTLTITGIGNYTGELTYTFTIDPATPALALSAVTKTYDGQPVSDPAVTVTLVNNEEYTGTPTVTYYAVGSDGTETELDEAPSAVGSYKVVVTVSDAGANYETVSAEASFTIIEADMTAEITGFNVPYDGQAHDVTVTAEDGATVTVTYTDGSGNTVTAPTEAGTYTAHVTVTKTGYTTVEQDVTVTITAVAQAVSYETATVTKTEGDDPFTNPLTQTIAFGEITYTSSDTDVATVDESGQVTIIGPGTTTITASVSGTDSYTAVTASYTLTVTAVPVETPTETEEQIVVDDLTQVPEGLQGLYSTVEELKEGLFSRINISDPDYTEDNVAYYDVKLQIWNGETGQWEDATEEDFPAEGITVTLPYPTGTDSSYDFVVAHMFTVSSQRLGITAGDTETPAVTKTEDGLTVTLTGLSPVAVAWKEAEAEATPTPTATAAATTTPNTGDGNTPLLWLALLALCAAGLGIVTGKRKRVR